MKKLKLKLCLKIINNNMRNTGSCLGCLITLFIVWAILFGLTTPWGKLDIDIFPPQILLN